MVSMVGSFSVLKQVLWIITGTSYCNPLEKTYQKIDDNTVFARIDRDKLMSFGAFLGAGFVSKSTGMRGKKESLLLLT